MASIWMDFFCKISKSIWTKLECFHQTFGSERSFVTLKPVGGSKRRNKCVWQIASLFKAISWCWEHGDGVVCGGKHTKPLFPSCTPGWVYFRIYRADKKMEIKAEVMFYLYIFSSSWAECVLECHYSKWQLSLPHRANFITPTGF